MAESISVQVAYAFSNHQEVVEVTLGDDATVQAAVEASGLLKRFPEIDLARHKVGVFSKLVQLDERLRDGDRVEIYRPLGVDPKESRRRRVEQRRLAGRGQKPGTEGG